MRTLIGSTILAAACFAIFGCGSQSLGGPDGGTGGTTGAGGAPWLTGFGGSSTGGSFGTGGCDGCEGGTTGAGGYATGGNFGTGGFATGGDFGTGGFATGGNFGTGGTAFIVDGGVDAVGGLTCPALTTPATEPDPISPLPGCPCTRRPGVGNSYLCPMGAGATQFAQVDPQGTNVLLFGVLSQTTNVPISIQFPAGAVDVPTVVSITETTVPPPAGLLDWSPVYLIEPRGLVLHKVAKLGIPFSNVTTVPGDLAIYARSEAAACAFAPIGDSQTTVTQGSQGFTQASLTQLGYVMVASPLTVDPSTCGADAATRD
ncbi:MAG TPA: hypothetical protein VKZ18_18330 [Polyangia bacterium]|nr:hypothetical protein [Polyangia bacterium]